MRNREITLKAMAWTHTFGLPLVVGGFMAGHTHNLFWLPLTAAWTVFVGFIVASKC